MFTNDDQLNMSLVGIVSRGLSAKLNPNRLVKCGALFTGSRVGIASESPAEVQKDYPVCSDTEWDPLEEVILGRPDGSCYSDLNMDMKVSESSKLKLRQTQPVVLLVTKQLSRSAFVLPPDRLCLFCIFK